MASIVKTESFNTNNSWGFGGGIGTYTYYDNDFVYKVYKAFYRHSPSTRHKELYFVLGEDLIVVRNIKQKVLTKLPTKGQIFTLMESEGRMPLLIEGDHQKIEFLYHTYLKVKNITA